MNSRRSEQHVTVRSSDMDLMLYAIVVPLFAILLVYQVYLSSSTAFLETIHNHSILSVISPARVVSIIQDALESGFSLSSLAPSVKLPSASQILGSCLSILTRTSLDTLVSTAQWATEKPFTCEIPYVITIAITWFFSKVFHVTYLRIFISTASLLVTYVSSYDFPKEQNSLHAARQQFRNKICAFCCVIFTGIDYATLVRATIYTLHYLAHKSWEREGITWRVDNNILGAVLMAVIGLSTLSSYILGGARNVLESWRFVESARQKEAARFALEADAIERVITAMKQSGRLMEDEGEERMKEEALREIICLYEAIETPLNNTK